MILSLLFTLPLAFGMSFSDLSAVEGPEGASFSVDLCEGLGQGCSFLSCTAGNNSYGSTSCPEKQVPTKYRLAECIVQNISMAMVQDGEAFAFYQNSEDKTYSMVIFNETECDAKYAVTIVATAPSTGCATNAFSTGGKYYGGFIPNPVSTKTWEAQCHSTQGPGGPGGPMPGWAIALIIIPVSALAGAGAFFLVRSLRSRGYTAV